MPVSSPGQAGAQWSRLPPFYRFQKALAALHAVEREVPGLVRGGVAAGRGPGDLGGAVSFRAAGRFVGGGDAGTVSFWFCESRRRRACKPGICP